MSAVVVIQKITTGTEAERLLDALEEQTGVHGERRADGRSYYLASAVDWDAGVAGLGAVLDRLSDTWSIHLGFRAPN